MSEPRGFPADFEIVDGYRHPIASLDVHRSGRTNCNPRYLYVDMGDWGYSWLHADEILNAPAPKYVRKISIPIEVYRQWDGISSPFDYCWQPCRDDYVKHEDFATPENITENTKFVVVEWRGNYSDFSDFSDFSVDFFDEVRRLKTLHGEVRFVFGFG